MTPRQLLEAARSAGLVLTWTPDGKLSARGPRAAASIGNEILNRHGEFAECSGCGGVAVAAPARCLCATCAEPSARVIPLRPRGTGKPAVPPVADSAEAERWRCDFCGWRQAQPGQHHCESCGWPAGVTR